MKKIILSAMTIMSLGVLNADAGVTTITVHGFKEPGPETAAPAPGGTTYTVNCSPSGATCATCTVITQFSSPTPFVDSYGQLTIYDKSGTVSSQVVGYCKDVHYDENNIIITLSSERER